MTLDKLTSLTYLSSIKQGYKDWVKNNKPEALLPGLNKTNEQLLFVSFAQVRKCENTIES